MRIGRGAATAVCMGASAAALVSASATAQETPTQGDAPSPTATELEPPETAATTLERHIYAPADFARFAPKNAFDMLRQVPGFSVRDSEQLRGLGQATGNVLVNGQRLSKSDDAFTQLSRIPAGNVVRIEIVDGATLDLPGLSGEVANVIVKADAFSGQFSYETLTAAHFDNPLLTRGAVSVSGTKGLVQYELGLDNSDSGRRSAGGPTTIFDGGGRVTERRNDLVTSRYDSPKLSGRFVIDGPSNSAGNLNAHYQRTYYRFAENGIRVGGGLPDRTRSVRDEEDAWNWEIGGDYQFALGPGRFKAIGLNRKSHRPGSQTIITRFAGGRNPVGDRSTVTGDTIERIGRVEYSWKMFGGDWELSGEAAFNSLDNLAALFTLDPVGGEFVERPFPGGSGGVTEDRYEGLLSFSRPLSKKLSFQIVGGAERSTLTQTGPNGLTRSFFRPKGTFSVAWKPSADFDLSAKLRRRVLQLSFSDFLARAFLNDDNQNAGNNQLVPQQDWSVEIEANKKLGAWGSSKLRLIYRDVEDYVDIVPIGANGESVGNIDKAFAAAINWISTIQFDPLGWKGAKLDARVVLQKSRLTDPFTGEKRQFSGFTTRIIELNFRRDIPGSDWAYGGGIDYSRNQPRFRRTSTDRFPESPSFASLFVENKNVFGLTVRAALINFNNFRSKRDRTVYTGLRSASPIAFVEKRDRLIGPIFRFSVKGNF